MRGSLTEIFVVLAAAAVALAVNYYVLAIPGR
jgi:hypothetical protein